MASVTKNPGAGNGLITNYKTTGGTRDETLWDEVVAGTGTTKSAVINPSAATLLDYSGLGAFTDLTLYVYRSFFPFDCTDLTGYTINSAVLRLYIVAKPQNSYSETVEVVGSTQASYSTLATSDFSLVGSQKFSNTSPTMASITTGAYLEFTLNSQGRAAIASGDGRLAVRLSGDFTSTLPAAPGFSDTGNQITTYYLAHGSSMPELVVDYTVPVGTPAVRRRPSGLYLR